MKKLVFFAALLAAGLSQADDSVQVYGTLDVGVTSVNHALSSSANIPPSSANLPVNANAVNSVTGLSNGGLTPSNWGIRGQEDLGDGIKAVFKLESMIVVPTGTIPNSRQGEATNKTTGPLVTSDSFSNGQLFGRAAYVGISSIWGDLTAGRQTSFGVDQLGEYDPQGAGYAVSPLGFYGSYSGGGVGALNRWDNSIKYVNQISGVKFGAMYGFGATSNSFTTGQNVGLTLAYSDTTYGVQATYLKSEDALKGGNENGTTVPVGSISATALNTEAEMLSARHTVGQFTTKAGIVHMKFTNPSNAAFDATTTALSGIQVATVNTTAYGTPYVQNIVWLGETVQLTPKLKVTVADYYLTQNSYASSAGVVTAAGHANYVSAMLDYNFSKRTDTYLAVIDSKLGGPAYNAYASKNVSAVTLGIRTKF